MKLAWFALTAFSILILVGCNSTPPPARQAPSPSPSAESYPNLTARAKELEDAIGRKDYKKVVELTYPKLVDLLGGREKMLADMTTQMKSMETEGVELLSSVASPPTQFVQDANGIYAVVPVTTKLKAKDGIFQTEGSLIGISNDGGATWTFLDASGKDQKELKNMLPNVDKLNLPPEKPPTKLSN